MGIRRVRECANVSDYTGSGTGHIHSAPKEPAAIITPATKKRKEFYFYEITLFRLRHGCRRGYAGSRPGRTPAR